MGVRALAWALCLIALPANAACPDVRSATVVRVMDGDTFVADLSLPFNLTARRKVRLLGYNAPESSGAEKPYGEQATAALASLLPAGSSVYVDACKEDQYGRTISTVVRSDASATSVIDALVAGGWGVRWNGRGIRPTPWLIGVPYPIVEVTQ